MQRRLRTACLAVAIAMAAHCASPAPGAGLGAREAVADGVELFQLHDPALVEGAGPIAIAMLRLDPAKVRVDSVLSNDEVLETETVEAIAARRHAIAAINGGYFNRANGEPVGLLKVGGELVSDSPAFKGAVAIFSPPRGRTTLVFDRLAARMQLRVESLAGSRTMPIDGVDTTRERGKLMLYTPAYHADTDTAPTGTEWVLDGSPLQVVDVREGAGHTPIPRTGAVLSYGGVPAPASLGVLARGARVSFETVWRSAHGVVGADLDRADHVINGAGLLRRNGEDVHDWEAESLSLEAFVNARHPRTLVGVDGDGFIWLAAIDGRQADRSIGMTFFDLQRLCDRLKLKDALNLDGGGSTTMVVNGRVVNEPSDPIGARQVSDAIVVVAR